MNKFEYVEDWKEKINKGEAIAIIWDIDDVIGCAKDNNIKLKKTEAKDILAIIQKYYDANEGINWDVIESTICSYKIC